eukprot:3003306-Lingulodinium_polyedra.AAC.1
MRLVLDQRRENLRWTKPPWSPMANVALFPFVDTSSSATGGREVQTFTGDLPDWYYTLELPEVLSEFFTLEGVTARD